MGFLSDLWDAVKPDRYDTSALPYTTVTSTHMADVQQQIDSIHAQISQNKSYVLYDPKAQPYALSAVQAAHHQHNQEWAMSTSMFGYGPMKPMTKDEERVSILKEICRLQKRLGELADEPGS